MLKNLTVFYLTFLLSILTGTGALAQVNIQGEIINMDAINGYAFSDLTQDYLSKGDIVQILDGRDLITYLEVVEVKSTFSRLGFAGQMTQKEDFQTIDIGNRVVIADKAKEVARIDQDNQQYQKKVDSLNQIITALTQELDNMKSLGSASKLKKDLDEVQKSNEKLNTKLLSFQKLLQDKTADVAQIKEENTVLRDKAKRLEKKLQEKDQFDRTSLEAKLSEAQKDLQTIDQLSRQKIALSDSLALANKKIVEQEKIIDELKGRLAKQDEEVKLFNDKLSKYKAQRDAAQLELLEGMRQVKEIESSIPGLIKAVRQPLEDRLALLTEELDVARLNIKEANLRLSKVSGEKNNLRNQLVSIEENRGSLHKQFEQVTTELNEKTDSLQKMQDRLTAMKKEKALVMAYTAQLEDRNKGLENKIGKKGNMESDLREMEEKRDFLKQQLAILNDRTNNIDAITSKLKEVQEPFTDEIARLEADVGRLKKELDEKNIVIQSLRKSRGAETIMLDMDAVNVAFQEDQVDMKKLLSIKERIEKSFDGLSNP